MSGVREELDHANCFTAVVGYALFIAPGYRAYAPRVIELVALLRRFRMGVVSTVSATGQPQAAIVGIAVGDALELVFDTLSTTRKYTNLVREPRVAVVMGEGELTIQLEGRAEVPAGAELARAQATYFAAWPDGRDRAAWANITWVRVRPTWIRVSDFAALPPAIREHAL